MNRGVVLGDEFFVRYINGWLKKEKNRGDPWSRPLHGHMRGRFEDRLLKEGWCLIRGSL